MDEIIQCNILEGIPLQDKSVHCVVTSPPYWGLRDYGVAGQLGLEKTPEEYIERMVGVFRHVWRVMRDDATLFLNMGDSYAQSHGSGPQGDSQCWRPSAEIKHNRSRKRQLGGGLKPKDLCMMPARLAIALQADGWYLRSDIIWAKPNPMPESVTDRPTKSHEHLFLLTKKPKYFYDSDAIREDVTGTAHDRGTGVNPKAVIGTGVGYNRASEADPRDNRNDRPRVKQNESFSAAVNQLVSSRNKRDVWTIPTQACDYDYCLICHKLFTGKERGRIIRKNDSRLCPQCKEDNWVEHFATFPEKLVQPCIKAGTSEKGCCPECGSPWVRKKVDKHRDICYSDKYEDKEMQSVPQAETNQSISANYPQNMQPMRSRKEADGLAGGQKAEFDKSENLSGSPQGGDCEKKTSISEDRKGQEVNARRVQAVSPDRKGQKKCPNENETLCSNKKRTNGRSDSVCPKEGDSKRGKGGFHGTGLDGDIDSAKEQMSLLPKEVRPQETSYDRPCDTIDEGREPQQGEHCGGLPPLQLSEVEQDWLPSCNCNITEPIPCTVYDPFGGAMTTCLVAYKLNRHYIATELNQEYIEMGRKRLAAEKDKFGLFE